MLKLAPISLVLPKGFNMRVLQILAPPSLRLGLLESSKNYNTYIVNIQYKCQSMSECNSYRLNCDIHCIHKQKIIIHHILKCVDIALPSSKNTLPCCEKEFIGNIWIYNPMLHYLYPLKEIFTMRTTKNHCVPCNMWNSMQYEKACSLALNYYTLIIWTNMVLLVHKESKSTNEFTRFCNELGEF
jgi:hypothetical protein